MSEGYKAPERVEHDARADQAVNIQFTKILHGRDALLVRLVDVRLQTATYVLEYLIYDGDCECRVVALQVVCEHREHTDASKLDLPRFCEHVVQRAYNGGVIPVQFADESQHLVDCLLR